MDTDHRMHIHVNHPPVADPAPLGLAAFALTTFVLSAHNAGWAPDLIWIGLGLFYGGVIQFAAGMWEFRRNNTFGATAFSTYGGFWLSLAIFIVFIESGVLPAAGLNLDRALGWYVAAFFIINTFLWITSALSSIMVFLVFTLLEITLLCLFIGFFSHQAAGQHATWTMAGGYMGIFTAIMAWIAAFAIMFNESAGRAIIPVGSPLLNFLKNEPESQRAGVYTEKVQS